MLDFCFAPSQSAATTKLANCCVPFSQLLLEAIFIRLIDVEGTRGSVMRYSDVGSRLIRRHFDVTWTFVRNSLPYWSCSLHVRS